MPTAVIVSKPRRIKCDECSKTRKDGAHFQIHHKHPRCMGGSDDPENLRCLCDACHRKLHSENGDFARWGAQGGKKAAKNPRNMRRLFQFRNMTDEQFEDYLRMRELAGIVTGQLPQWLQN